MSVLSVSGIAGLVLLIGGLAGLASGLFWKRRIGSEPRCRRCGYDLTGLTRPVCPECGASLFPGRAVVFGRRERRRGLIVVGMSALLVGLLVGGPRAATLLGWTNWYQVCPTWLLLLDLRSGDLQTADRAAQALDKRYRADELSEDQIRSVIDALVARVRDDHENRVPLPHRHELLKTLFDDGKFTARQLQRLCDLRLRGVDLKVRPHVVRGDELPVYVETTMVGPVGPVQATFWRVFELDGQARPDYLGGHGASSGPGTHIIGKRVDISDLAPGKHTARVVVDASFFPTLEDVGRDKTPIFSRRFDLTADFEVLAERPPDYIRLVRSPEIDRDIVELLGLDAIHKWYVTRGKTSSGATLYVRAPRLPVPLAMEALAEYGSRILARGSLVVGDRDSSPTATMLSSTVHFELPLDVPDTVDVRLRPSREIAARTASLFEIWGGELLFKDVPVVDGSAPTPVGIPGIPPILVNSPQTQPAAQTQPASRP